MAASRSGTQLPDATATEPASQGSWSLAERSAPAFAVSQFNLHDKTEAYEIFRHPEGGRKDLFRWSGADRKPVAELEIYRPGGELDQSGPRRGRTFRPDGPGGTRELEAAGVIDSNSAP